MKSRIRSLRKVVLRELNEPEASKVVGGTDPSQFHCDTVAPPTACNGDASISNQSCYWTDCGTNGCSYAVACSTICTDTCEC